MAMWQPCNGSCPRSVSKILKQLYSTTINTEMRSMHISLRTPTVRKFPTSACNADPDDLAAGCPFVPSGGNFTLGTVTKMNGAMLTLATAGGKSMTVTTDGSTK